MRFRKLRIAFSATCLIACVLLLVFWMRSFRVTDLVARIDDQRIATTIGSQYGAIYLAHFNAEIGYRGTTNSSAPHTWVYKALTGYTSNHGLFVWNRSQHSLYAELPHWLFAVVATMIGAGVWLPWRFSLRTMLIATTLMLFLQPIELIWFSSCVLSFWRAAGCY
jgi:hypothetical protein